MNNTKSSVAPVEAASVLDTCLVDLNLKSLDPVIGREDEINRVIEVLSRKDKSNPILVGEAGVGKTSVVYGLVNRIKEGNVPLRLQNKKVLLLDVALLANNIQYIKGIFNEVSEQGGILFIDEIHNIVGAGRTSGSLDVSNIMKPLLSNGDITCIGATTYEEYNQYFEKDAALDRRFQRVEVLEPTVDKAIDIIKQSKSRYELFHGIKIAEEAILSAVSLSKRYLADKQLPDKAFDLIDEASSRLSISLGRHQLLNQQLEAYLAQGDLEKASEIKYGILPTLEKRDVLNSSDIAKLISDKTGIPVSNLTLKESEKLLKIEEYMKAQIIGQDEAISSVANAIRTTRMGVKNKNSSFLFLGPSGCGKTETAKVLAKFLFEDENAIIRLDMSEYGEKHMVSRLIGASAGYVGYEEGGVLTNAIKRRPYSVILLDEVEKAHPDIFNMFLQVLDDNRLTDGKGRTIDFKNVVIIMTSNLKESQLKTFFRPEFLNRIDEVIIYHELNKEELYKIADLEIKKLAELISSSHGVKFMLESSLRDALVENCCSPEYGARPLKRAIYKQIGVQITNAILKGLVKRGELIILKK